MTRKLWLPIVMVAAFAVSAYGQDEKTVPWIDMENCEICKQMGGHEELMVRVQWQTYLIDNGFLSVSVIPEDLKPKMQEVMEGMKKTIAKIGAGAEVKLCPHCMGYGELMAAGAQMQEIQTIGGDVTLFTSTDPEVVERLHEHARKTQEAHEVMMKQLHQHGDHSHGADGHSHDAGGHSHGEDGHSHDADGHSHDHDHKKKGGG